MRGVVAAPDFLVGPRLIRRSGDALLFTRIIILRARRIPLLKGNDLDEFLQRLGIRLRRLVLSLQPYYGYCAIPTIHPLFDGFDPFVNLAWTDLVAAIHDSEDVGGSQFLPGDAHIGHLRVELMRRFKQRVCSSSLFLAKIRLRQPASPAALFPGLVQFDFFVRAIGFPVLTIKLVLHFGGLAFGGEFLQEKYSLLHHGDELHTEALRIILKPLAVWRSHCRRNADLGPTPVASAAEQAFSDKRMEETRFLPQALPTGSQVVEAYFGRPEAEVLHDSLLCIQEVEDFQGGVALEELLCVQVCVNCVFSACLR